MKKPHARSARLLLGATLLVLVGCANPPPTDWNRVSLQDRHQYMPTLTWDDRRPLAVVTAGPTGMLVGAGNAAAPAVALVMQDGQPRLVSQQTLAQMRDSGQLTGAMGASPAAPAPPASPAPTR